MEEQGGLEASTSGRDMEASSSEIYLTADLPYLAKATGKKAELITRVLMMFDTCYTGPGAKSLDTSDAS